MSQWVTLSLTGPHLYIWMICSGSFGYVCSMVGWLIWLPEHSDTCATEQSAEMLHQYCRKNHIRCRQLGKQYRGGLGGAPARA